MAYPNDASLTHLIPRVTVTVKDGHEKAFEEYCKAYRIPIKLYPLSKPISTLYIAECLEAELTWCPHVKHLGIIPDMSISR